MGDREVQDFLDRDTLRQVLRIADRLTGTADRLTRLAGYRGELYSPNGGAPAHHKLVAQVLAEVRGMQGNLMLEQLVSAAVDAELEATGSGYRYDSGS